MRHHKKLKIGRKGNANRALVKSLGQMMVEREKIITNEKKARLLRPYLERMITRAKIDNLSNRRYLLKYFSPRLTDKLIKTIGPKYLKRQGGYLRIIKYKSKKGDNARQVIIEMV